MGSRDGIFPSSGSTHFWSCNSMNRYHVYFTGIVFTIFSALSVMVFPVTWCFNIIAFFVVSPCFVFDLFSHRLILPMLFFARRRSLGSIVRTSSLNLKLMFLVCIFLLRTIFSFSLILCIYFNFFLYLLYFVYFNFNIIFAVTLVYTPKELFDLFSED